MVPWLKVAAAAMGEVWVAVHQGAAAVLPTVHRRPHHHCCWHCHCWWRRRAARWISAWRAPLCLAAGRSASAASLL